MFADRIECAFNIIDGLEKRQRRQRREQLKQKNKKNKKGGQVVRKSAGNPRKVRAAACGGETVATGWIGRGSSPSPSSRPSTAPEVNIADKKVREKHGVRKTRRPLSSSSSSSNNNNGRGRV